LLVGSRDGLTACSSWLLVVHRARQFSSFLVVLGRLGPARTFEPSHAMIVKDKDEISIPLLLEQLPTPKAFRDAIASLSPEQQRFAQAVRSMQLSGSVFGLLVLQLKPQLEALLRLAPQALTKEIKLTQTLLDLFISYQIPSDLLSYDGDEAVSAQQKLESVKAHVKAITDMVEAAKAAEVAAERQRADFAHPHVHSAAASGAGASAPRVEAVEEELDGAAPPVRKMMRRSRSVARHAEPVSLRMAAAAPVAMAEEMTVELAAAPMDDAMPAAVAYAGTATIARDEPNARSSPVEAATSPTAASAANGAAAANSPAAAAAASAASTAAGAPSASAIDFTALPHELNAAYERLDSDAAIRPTTIRVSDTWHKRAQRALLSPPADSTISTDEQVSPCATPCPHHPMHIPPHARTTPCAYHRMHAPPHARTTAASRPHPAIPPTSRHAWAALAAAVPFYRTHGACRSASC
jgi:hypothetical protein